MLIKVLLVIWFVLFFWATAFSQEQLFFKNWYLSSIIVFSDQTAIALLENPDKEAKIKEVEAFVRIVRLESDKAFLQILGYSYKDEEGKERKFVRKGEKYIEEKKEITF